ncbi:MAG: GDSL-type esterase/lipase family protein [Planctomycetota bacterium]|nr:GDSL-type esterase/lipase family protein [Planctomycetota bacterium]
MNTLRRYDLAALACGALAVSFLFAGDLSTTRPAEKDPQRHTGFLDDIKNMHGTINLVFVGDSITDGWRGGGRQVWDKYFAPHKALNLGIGGDRTEHVLWRLQHGELDGYEAHLFVVMIGTNNGDPAPDVAEGIKAILEEIRTKQPQANILLLGIFPRGEKADGGREKNASVNKLIAKFDDGVVHYLDIGAKFLQADGTMSAEIMPDFLHPSPKGYEIWAEAIDASVKLLLQESNTAALAGPGPYKRLANLAAQVKAGIGLGQVLKTLAQKKESKDAAEAAEAKMMFDALQSGGQKNLDAALAYKDTKPILALPRLDRVAAQFAGDEIGTKAKQGAEQLRKDPKVVREVEADQMLKKLQAFEQGFKAAGRDRDRSPKSPQFRKVNAQGIETLIAGCQQLIQRYPGTVAAQKAEALMNDYR